MRSVALVLTLLSIACSSSTEPGKAGDPSILVTNNLGGGWIYITWKDGNGIAGRDSVAPHTIKQCVRFLAQPDSAYWEATITENGSTATVTTPEWFNPADRPAWTLESLPGPNLLQADSDPPC